MSQHIKSSIAEPSTSYVAAQVYPPTQSGGSANGRRQSMASLRTVASANSKASLSGSEENLSVLPLDGKSRNSMNRVAALFESGASARRTMGTIKTAESSGAIETKITREDIKSLKASIDTLPAPPATSDPRMRATSDDVMTVQSTISGVHQELYGTPLY